MGAPKKFNPRAVFHAGDAKAYDDPRKRQAGFLLDPTGALGSFGLDPLAKDSAFATKLPPKPDAPPPPPDETAPYFKEMARRATEQRMRQSKGRNAAFAPYGGSKIGT